MTEDDIPDLIGKSLLAPDRPAGQNAGKKRRRVIIGLVVLALVAVVAVLVWPRVPHLFRIVLEHVREQMTREEVGAMAFGVLGLKS